MTPSITQYAVRVTHAGADAEGPFWTVENGDERY